MKTPGSYRDEPGSNNRNSRGENYRRSEDRDKDRLFPEDGHYDNRYDVNNRSSYEPGYNSYDRSHSGYDNQRNRYGYDRDNRENTGRYNDSLRTTMNSETGRFKEDNSFRNEGFDRSEGYRGRTSDDYTHRNPYWNDYYDASDNYRRSDGHGYTYRHDEDYERERMNPGPKGVYSWGRENEDNSKGNYGYYESYPSYGQSESYGDHERYTGKTRGYKAQTDEYWETDQPEERKPNIRDRRFW